MGQAGTRATRRPSGPGRAVHTALLESFEENATLWNGHRVFAVDGSKFNLPKTLQPDGFKRPSPNAAYPQGLVSCLYRLQDKLPYDVDLAPGGDERTLARHHSRLLKPEDIVVYDRGYVSRALLAHPIDHRLHAVFRIRRKADTQVDRIFESAHPDTVLTLRPRTMDPTPRTVRIVRIVRAPKLRRGPADNACGFPSLSRTDPRRSLPSARIDRGTLQDRQADPRHGGLLMLSLPRACAVCSRNSSPE